MVYRNHGSPKSQNSSIRPVPNFIEETRTFSTKKERKTVPIRPPPKPQIKTCPQKSRIFQQRPQMNAAQSVTFLDSAQSSSLHEEPLLNSQVYDSGKKVSYFEQAFVIESKIGAGCFGNVYRVRSKDDGQLFAVKIARDKYRGVSDRREKLEEVRKHQYLLPHTNCVHFYQSWEENGRLYQQFELCDKSLNELSEEKHELPEKLIWSYLVDLLLAVKHLHDHDLIHMDIKPENIFIGMDGICKLGDFGLVIDLAKNDSDHLAEGDPRYLAAEVLHERKFSKAADIFALGVTFLELACDLDLPKQGQLWHELRQTGPDPKLTSHLSSDLRRVIQLMMANDWERRPTVHQVLSLPSVQSALKARARELYLSNLTRTLKSYLMPIVLFMMSFISVLAQPLVKGAKTVWNYLWSSSGVSTPEHLIRRSESDSDSKDKSSTVTGNFFSFLTSTAKKKKFVKRSVAAFSSDDDDDEISNLSSSRSVLASLITYSDDNDEDRENYLREKTRIQLREDLGEKQTKYSDISEGINPNTSFEYPTPHLQRRRPFNDLVKTTPGGLKRTNSRIPRSPTTWTPKKKLEFELDQLDFDESPTTSLSRCTRFDPDSSFGFVGSKVAADEQEDASNASLQIKPLNLAAKFDCFSDTDEDD